jgi:hypothetical protein
MKSALIISNYALYTRRKSVKYNVRKYFICYAQQENSTIVGTYHDIIFLVDRVYNT